VVFRSTFPSSSNYNILNCAETSNLLLHLKVTTFKVRDSAYRVAMTSDPISYLPVMRQAAPDDTDSSDCVVQLSFSRELSLGSRDTYGA